MASLELSSEYHHQLNIFRNQYLQLQIKIIYPTSNFLQDASFQEALYEEIFQEGILRHPPPNRYKLRVLKELLRRIEESIIDWEEQGVSDNLMISLSSLISIPLPPEPTSAIQKSYVTYNLSSLSHLNRDQSSPPNIVLLEARNVLSGSGTTGLRTWDASLHLATYLTKNPSIISQKSILELGAGLGLLSILCAKYLGAKHVTCTDGSEEVMAEMPTNLFLNGLENSPKITGKELKWGHALIGGEEAEWNGGQKIDLVLGADLIYDGPGVPALLGTLADLFDMFPSVEVLISQCVRNRERFDRFLETCGRNGFVVKEIECEMKVLEEQEGPFYDIDTPIKLLIFSRKFN